MSHLRIEDVQKALAYTPFDVPAAHRLMAPLTREVKRPADFPGQVRRGSVLLLLYCHQEKVHLVLTRRRDDLNAHAGQISFPGGRQDLDETGSEAALRETHEEVGVPPSAITLLGQLASIWIPPSDFKVTPFVGWIQNGRRPVFQPAAEEVAEILEVPLTHLLAPATRKEGEISGRDYHYMVPYFDVQGQMVWGATAVMLSEFLERLRLVLGER